MSREYVFTPARQSALAQLHEQTRANRNAVTEQVIRLMCEGLCDKVISKRLGISVGSIKHNRALYMARHQIKSRTQLGVWAVRQGLV